MQYCALAGKEQLAVLHGTDGGALPILVLLPLKGRQRDSVFFFLSLFPLSLCVCVLMLFLCMCICVHAVDTQSQP